MSFNIGDILQGEVIDFTHKGKGIVKIDNMAIFVEKAIIGDIIQLEIKENKKNFHIGKLIKIIKPSEDRISDNLFRESGETPFINYKYEAQLKWKEDKVKTDLRKFAGLNDVIVNPIIGMDDPYRYRNHVQIPVGSKNGKAVLGFFERGSHNIVDMKATSLQPEIGDKILETVKLWIDKYNIVPYDRRAGKGMLRHIGIRTNADNEAMLILVTATEKLSNSDELIRMINKELPQVVSIYHNINKLQSAPTYGREYRKLFGKDHLIDHIGSLKFKISPNSFFQVNRIQAEVLYSHALSYLNLKNTDTAADIYCGIGTISLFIAKHAKEVYGIESVPAAIRDAKENSKLNNISNAQFHLGKAEEVFPKLIKEGLKPNKVIVDPPRKGCEKEVLEAIVELKPEVVVYVSCNPTTMARDVRYLLDEGYEVKQVQPVDMFAHTSEIECVMGLVRL